MVSFTTPNYYHTMRSGLFFLAFFSVAFAYYDLDSNQVDEFCTYLSEQDNLPWRVNPNPTHATTWDDAIKLHGLQPRSADAPIFPWIEHDESSIEIPAEFDSRKHWPQCTDIIGHIQSQGGCGSCWAVSTTSVMSDRICIHSNGKVKKWVSAQDVMDCCPECNKGCDVGGSTEAAFDYWAKTGITTGGEDPDQGCKSYQARNEVCIKQCDYDTNLDYDKEMTVGRDLVMLMNGTVTQIQLEIMKNGPVTASFRAYRDFHCYQSGVYRHKLGEEVGGHAVRIMGWGVEDESPYWLIANSWGPNWALKGVFKMLRGNNECGIEERIVAGLPKLQKHANPPKCRFGFNRF